MKITALEMNGFRGFTRNQAFDLDADAVILSGTNGQGKTSLFDAILWALTGNVQRLGTADAGLLSVYSETGQFRVRLDLENGDHIPLCLIRSFDGEKQELQIETNGRKVRGPAANSTLLEQLWPAALSTADSGAALTAAVTRSVYLQQDLVRQFIEADTEQSRFTIVSELVGAGRVTELQVQLERAKTAWSKATNDRDREAQSVRQRVAMSESQLNSLTQAARPEAAQIEVRWAEWWKQTQGVTRHANSPVHALKLSRWFPVKPRAIRR